jgi:hypothetical protein|tara:strand:+ start:590 stop:1315 length:726 start_codon:yes stop_codon:yes gene_type:complete
MAFSIPFLRLRKHIELDVYTNHGGLHEGEFLGRANRNPHMSKCPLGDGKTRQSYQARPISISSCYGMREARKKSLFLRSWMDWELVHSNREVSCNGMVPDLLNLDENHTHQLNGFAERHGIKVIKCVPPFQVRCAEEVQFIMSQSPFSPQCLSYPSGVTSFKYQHGVNFFIYINEMLDARWNFKAGDDIVMFTPLSDRPLKITTHYSPETFDYLADKNKPLRDSNAFTLKIKSIKEKDMYN